MAAVPTTSGDNYRKIKPVLPNKWDIKFARDEKCPSECDQRNSVGFRLQFICGKSLPILFGLSTRGKKLGRVYRTVAAIISEHPLQREVIGRNTETYASRGRV